MVYFGIVYTDLGMYEEAYDVKTILLNETDDDDRRRVGHCME